MAYDYLINDLSEWLIQSDVFEIMPHTKHVIMKVIMLSLIVTITIQQWCLCCHLRHIQLAAFLGTSRLCIVFSLHLVCHHRVQ